MGIIVDLFAGGGGASQGIFNALGRHPDVAINHSTQAVAIHAANHPDTEHWCNDVWSVDPSWVAGKYNQPVDLLWASPDCTHHSKAKGGPPNRDERRRDLAMVISHKWVPVLLPRLIILENVEEFLDWGPCDSKGVPIEAARGENFRAFINALRRRGYRVEWRELSSCDYGAPTIRKRLFIIARRDRLPIVWPEPTHGAPNSPEVLSGKLLPWRAAAEIIDWSLPCPSIFATSREIWEAYGLRAVRPLAENTMKRIAKGLERYVLNNPNPFIINLAHTKKDGSYDCFRGCGLHDAVPTVTSSPGLGLVRPFIAKNYTGVVGQPIESPLGTITTIDHHALVQPFVVTNTTGHAPWGAHEPLSTVTTGGQQMLVSPFIVGAGGPKYAGKPVPADKPIGVVLPENHKALVVPHVQAMYGQSVGQGCADPLGTVTSQNKHALVSAFFVKYYGTGYGTVVGAPLHTATTRDRFSLVTVTINGEPYTITDIGMRMLSPRELLLAQGFLPSYVIDEAGGKPVSKKDQVAMIGNSVCPPVAEALVRANYRETTVEDVRDKQQAMPLFREMMQRGGVREVRV